MMAKSVYKTVIFGAGQIGQMTARLLSSPCQLLCFADNDPHKHGSYIGNIPVCSPDTAAALLPDLVILGVLDEERRNSMIKQMENLGYHLIGYTKPCILCLQDINFSTFIFDQMVN